MNKRAFTLLEVLIVVAILGILGGAGVGYYRNTAKNIEITSASRVVEANLKTVRGKAMNGESEMRWGVHFVNGSSDYYELFSTPTNYADPAMLVEASVYLPGGITFSDPVESGTKDVIFSRVAGTTTATSITLASQTESSVVSVSSVGTVY